MMTHEEAIAHKLRDVMKLRGLSQRDVGKMLHLEQSNVSYLINGKRRQNALDLYRLIASLNGQSLGQFFTELDAIIAQHALEVQIDAALGKSAGIDALVAEVRALRAELRTVLDKIERG
jgi:transcriptional regulator with XRE-family HTH domain